jgi:hypothetical protein
MTKKRLIDVYEAQKVMGCGLHNIWMLIRRLSLKAVKRGGKLYTCEQWIEEYYENRRSKDLHSIFNGRKVFNEAEGELSVAMVAKQLGVGKTHVQYYLETGRLKSIRRGTYHVILRPELERFIAEELEDCEDISQNA